MTEAAEKPTSPYPLRMADDVKAWIKQRAKGNDRTVHAELNRILKEVMEADEQKKQAA